MTFINTDGMAFIGPGSEWFWAMAQLLIVATTLIGLYQQLRAQNAANVLQRMEALQGAWDTPRMIHSRLTLALWRKATNGTSPTFEAQVALNWLCGFFENLSDLEEDGHLTWKEVENSWGMSLVTWWALLAPAIHESRINASGSFVGFERLARRAEREARRRGDDWALSETDLPELLDTQIARNMVRLRVLRDIESGVMPTVATPAAAASAATGAASGLQASTSSAESAPTGGE